MKDDIIYKENNEISNETMRNITPKQERKMKKRILIVTNHSYMFWQFRKELVEALQKEHEVILAMPFVGHEEDFRKMGIECIPVSMNRRGVNPFAEAKLLRDYKRLLQKISPDFVLTYSIKPNIYMGLLCSCKKIPYYANVQGLGTAFQKPVLAGFVTVLYRIAFRKVKYVFFENKENAREFGERNIVSADRQVVLPGAGINLEKYKMEPYPNHSRVHFLYLGRIMKEKGIEWVYIGSIDNVLLKMVDTLLMGVAIKEGSQIATRSIFKNTPRERIGSLCIQDGKVKVIEYSELPEDMIEAKDENGEILFGESHVMCNLFSLKALEKISLQNLQYHKAHKKYSYIDENGKMIEPEEPNAYKFEYFIFDSFEFFNQISIVRGKREEDFAPVKNKEAVDSPATASKLYNDYWRKQNGRM